MADGSMQFILESVKEVFLYYGDLIADAETQIELLENDLRLFIAFLQESDKQNCFKNALHYVKVREIRDLVYEIEELIEAKSIRKKTWHCLGKSCNDPIKLVNVAEKIKTINKKINHILGSDRNRLINGELLAPAYEIERVKEKKTWKMRKDIIVGFEEETKTIISYLMEETEQLDVISIIGLPGLGKTTLAHKIFHHPQVQSHFPIRIWVNVSNDFTKKAVYLSILSNFAKITDDVNKLTEQEIARSIRDYLKKSRFLVVMDDVWTVQAWIDLEDVFLPAHSSSKILVTSRNEKVARKANRNRDAFRPPLLTFEEGWLLLQLEVFGKPACPQHLEEFGKVIVCQCRGLPLAIVVIGGILIEKARFGDNMSNINVWRKVSQSVATYLNDDPERCLQDIISLSYIELPYYLRPCFLYLGMFPEDYAIPIKKLIWMWIAEGFIIKKKDITMEEIARDYLEELISRNLVMVDKIGLDGNIKTCKLHDTIRQFCITEAGSERENFFQEMKVDTGSSTDLVQCRRLSLLANTSRTIPELSEQCLRSLLIFADEKFSYPHKISKAFKLLRTLDAKPIIFSSCPKEYTKLFHLRYLVISGVFIAIPKAIGSLQNLQSLIVDSFYCHIKANIWEMVQLRHVSAHNLSFATMPKKIIGGKFGGQLQSLGEIDAKYCTEAVFDRVCTSLKKLRIRVHEVGTLLKIKSFDKLEKLEKLTIFVDYKCLKLPRLPEPLPPKLRRLSLGFTRLEWEYMSTLGKLETLEVLKLHDESFEGRNWVTTAGGFSRLEVLYIKGLDLAVWEAEADHFPRLKHLVLKRCRKLQEIPQGLGENLDKLELIGGSECLVDSARRIEAAKNSSSSSTINKFHLSIEKEMERTSIEEEIFQIILAYSEVTTHPR